MWQLQSPHDPAPAAQVVPHVVTVAGVTAELGEYIRLMAQDKAGCEYQMWLQHMQEFIAH